MNDRVKAFIDACGIGPDTMDKELFINSFIGEMEKGVAREESSLPMIPTYVYCNEQLPMDKYAVAVDVGGTNFRTALIKFTEEGAKIEQFNSYPTPGTRGKVSWQEFIGFIADCIRPMMEYTDRIAICISFPTSITPERDGIIHRPTKEVYIEGYEGRRVCEDLLATLNIEGAKAMVLNDTTAVLLCGLMRKMDPLGLIGLINGTGTNTCCVLPCEKLGMDGSNMIVVVESGGFVPPQRGVIDLELDANTIAPGIYIEEKLVSGAYMGEICRRAFVKAATQGIFSEECARNIAKIESFTTHDADAFGAGGENDIFTEEADKEAARMIIKAVFDRAAKHIACTLTAVMRYSGMEEGREVVVSADGSMFRKSRLFRPALERYVSEYAEGRTIKYMEIENSTIIGTAIGALMN